MTMTSAGKQILPSSSDLTQNSICDYLTLDEGESQARPTAQSRLSISQQDA